MKNKVMFLIIYIYGNTKFKKEIKSLLLKSDISEDIVTIDKLDLLKSTIKDSPKDIFLIDDSKIINNKLLSKINFLKPKDSIEKEYLEQYGIGDLCFNTMSGFINYITNRLNMCSDKDEDLEDILDTDDINIQNEEDIIIEEEIRDKDNIICIDDIFDSEMSEAISEYELNKENKIKD